MPSQSETNSARYALVVDDDRFTATLLSTTLEESGFVVSCAHSVADAIELLATVDPDVALVDLDLGDGPNGVDLIRHIRNVSPCTATVVVSSHRSAMLVDADGILPTDNSAFVVKSDMTSVEVLHNAINAAISNTPAPTVMDGDLPRITKAQAELLRSIAEGKSNLEISRARGVGTKAVERMIVRLYRSLGLPSSDSNNPRVEATRIYLAGEVTTQ